MACFKVIIEGSVQGVFFRSVCFEKAKELGLKGYVENLVNGSVKIVLEGEDKKINEFIKFCKNSPGNSKVKKITKKEVGYCGFTSFKIKRG